VAGDDIVPGGLSSAAFPWPMFTVTAVFMVTPSFEGAARQQSRRAFAKTTIM
jgi:hypothetical protein